MCLTLLHPDSPECLRAHLDHGKRYLSPYCILYCRPSPCPCSGCAVGTHSSTHAHARTHARTFTSSRKTQKPNLNQTQAYRTRKIRVTRCPVLSLFLLRLFPIHTHTYTHTRTHTHTLGTPYFRTYSPNFLLHLQCASRFYNTFPNFIDIVHILPLPSHQAPTQIRTLPLLSLFNHAIRSRLLTCLRRSSTSLSPTTS